MADTSPAAPHPVRPLLEHDEPLLLVDVVVDDAVDDAPGSHTMILDADDFEIDVDSWDVPTVAGVAAMLAIAAAAASYFPARRAASVNPVEALRAE